MEAGVFPGATLALASPNDHAVVAVGTLAYEPEAPAVTPGTLYDLASVTKVVAALGVTISLVADGALSLDTPVRNLVAGWTGHGKSRVTVGHLLSHTSGLAAHEPFYLSCADRDAVQTAVKRLPLHSSPGSRCVYSDLGIILLGEAVEAAAQSDFATLVRARVLEPLGLNDTMFTPSAELRPQIAPTEDDGWRGDIVHGVVHDENAYAMGGVAPHAGLFSTAADVASFGRSLLAGDRNEVATEDVLHRFTRLSDELPGPWAYGVRILGVDPLFGQLLSPRGFGVTGFTGTMLAVDPRRQLAIALLSNSVRPTRQNRGIYRARGFVLDAVLRAYDAAPQ